MKILHFASICSLLCLISSPSFAKLQNYNYSDEMCEYQNQFDSNRHSLKKIQDTLKLLNANFWPSHEASDSGYSLAKPPSLKTTLMLNKEYQAHQHTLQALIPVNLPAYQNLKSIKLRQAKDAYTLIDFKLQGLRDPKALLTQRFGSKCYALAQRMNLKGQDLIHSSRTLTLEYVAQERKAGRQYTEWYAEQINRFDREIKQAANKESYAFDNMMFHWHNCVNNSFPDDNKTLEQLNPQKDLFVKSKSYCDY